MSPDQSIPPRRVVAMLGADGTISPVPQCCRCRPCWSCRLLHPRSERHRACRPQEVNDVRDDDVR